MTPREHLVWMVGQCYRPPETSDEWAGWERNVICFGMLEGRIPLDGVNQPKPNFGKRILRQAHKWIELAIARQTIPLGSTTRRLVWSAGSAYAPAGYILMDMAPIALTVESAALGALRQLIVQYGPLIKQCPAPAVRAKHNERCGKWFVAGRPNQEYCGSTCLSRKTSRENPPKKAKGKRARGKLRRAR